jgi:hypothetical protein
MSKRTGCLAVFLSYVLFSGAWSVAQVPCAIRVDHANARTSATAGSPIVAILKRNDVVQVIGDVAYWYRIRVTGVSSAYIAKSTCTVLAENDPGDDNIPVDDFFNPPVPAPVSPTTSCVPKVVPANWGVCPAAGSGGIYGKAYLEKNRVTIPCAYEPTNVDQLLQLDHPPANVRSLPANDKRLQYLQALEAKAVMVDGYVALVKDGGQEGVNCKPSSRVDVHMELVDTDVMDPKKNRPTHVIAEVTPWFKEFVAGWSKSNLAQYASYVDDYSGVIQHTPAHVRIYGWMFFDEAHAGNGSKTWRGTEWEVHPITKIEVFDSGTWKEVE